MIRVKSLSVGDIVSVPDRVCFPGRRDPYEYENGKVLRLGHNKHGEPVALVHVYRSFHQQHYEKWFNAANIFKVSYHHRIGEEEVFLSEIKQAGETT